ncbi:MAG: HAD-IIB family hydrolase [Deltaproteobacteria bacterium]|nr:HAD-IIB family hydrolase [Deltaproteobacteria bacterium]
MESFHAFPQAHKKKIDYVLTDIDDTLTLKGRLPAVAYRAMERLHRNGIQVIPVTGRPAGWCDHIARMWPVAGIVGENGAFYFRYDEHERRMLRRYFTSEKQRHENHRRLEELKDRILSRVPGSSISADQAYREADLAIDCCEDVPPLTREAIDTIVKMFEEAGAQAKVSSIHVNGWFGDYDKLTMTNIFFEDVFSLALDRHKDRVIYVGDSPNDCPMFAFFPHSVGVANILDFKGRLDCEPSWITVASGGRGFAEMAEVLLSA